MTKEKFLKERISSYLQTRRDVVEELKSALVRAEVFQNGNIIWGELDDCFSSNSLEEVQLGFDLDWTDWVQMSPDFDSFSEKEKDEIMESDLFQQTPINVWEIWNKL